jgi:hypothetical protein
LELKGEKILGGDDIALRADDFHDVRDAANAVAHSVDLRDQMDGGCNLGTTAFDGKLIPVMPIMFSSRVSASRGVFAWIVLIDPSWPVFIACSTSSASAPRIVAARG